jgi:uncharacterized membrane protein YedE/YeeE
MVIFNPDDKGGGKMHDAFRLPMAAAALAVLAAIGAGTATAAEGGPEAAGVLSIWQMKRWSPYAAGIGIGVLSWLVFLLSDNTLGASGSYAKTAGMIEKLLRGPKVEGRAYYRENPPEIGWGWMLLAGLVVGAFLSAYWSGDFRLGMVPPMWEDRIGGGAFHRWLTAFGGGILLGIGSRWADGCTSGHGISGTLQLVVSSWVAVICFFVGGVLTALIMF